MFEGIVHLAGKLFEFLVYFGALTAGVLAVLKAFAFSVELADKLLSRKSNGLEPEDDPDPSPGTSPPKPIRASAPCVSWLAIPAAETRLSLG